MTRDLQPIEPDDAVELYLREKRTNASQATVYSHSSRLGHFVRWCDEKDIDDMNEITGRDLHKFKLWRRDDGDLNRVSLKTQIDTIRVFIRFCETIDAVRPDLSTTVQSPTITGDENSRDVMLESERADVILDYLERYEYASLPHVTLTLLWHTMMCRGAARALDVSDYDPDRQYIEVRHRPDTGTPIKNKADGERMIAVDDVVSNILDDWIADRRPDATDDHGREPLLATNYGRIHAQTIQKHVYAYTRPCVLSGECPHDRDVDSCEARTRGTASKCPSSVSPHAVRRGSITHWLKQDVPVRVVGDRANVSTEVLDQHYDRRTERERMEQRREFIDSV